MNLERNAISVFSVNCNVLRKLAMQKNIRNVLDQKISEKLKSRFPANPDFKIVYVIVVHRISYQTFTCIYLYL